MSSSQESESTAPDVAPAQSAESPVEYDGVPLLETQLDGTDYRIDAGRQGTALCISTRPSGSWTWSFAGEVRWNGSELRSRAFDRVLLGHLSTAFVQAIAELD